MIEDFKIRQRLEEREKSLSPYAVKSSDSRGRNIDEPSSPVRTAFQRDRDRIIHAKSFRRLKHKTQVFIAPLGDHFVTRLTHTLEVAQIARTIARALALNEDLTEAISLGHDLGHTPFGHVGEAVLNELNPGGFRHNEQSLRVVDYLEKDGAGLNLTWEVRDGILNHSKTGASGIYGNDWGSTGTLEADICKISDIIAYMNHDIGDAIRAKIITEADLPDRALKILGRSHSERINTLVCDIIENSWGASGEGQGEVSIKMGPAVKEAANLLRDYLFANVYRSISLGSESEKAREIIRQLYRYFTGHPEKLPEADRQELGIEAKSSGEEVTARYVTDYIAGMTDQYAMNLNNQILSFNN